MSDYLDTDLDLKGVREFIGAKDAKDVVETFAYSIKMENDLSEDQLKDYLKYEWKRQKKHVNETYPRIQRDKIRRTRVLSLMERYNTSYFASLSGIELLCAEIARQLLFRYSMCDSGNYMNSYEQFAKNTPNVLGRGYKEYCKGIPVDKEKDEFWSTNMCLPYEEPSEDDVIINCNTHEFSDKDPLNVYFLEVADDYLQQCGCIRNSIHYFEPLKMVIPFYFISKVDCAIVDPDYANFEFMDSNRFDEYLDKNSKNGCEMALAMLLLFLQFYYKRYDGISEKLLRKNIAYMIPRFLSVTKVDVDYMTSGTRDLEERIENL